MAVQGEPDPGSVGFQKWFRKQTGHDWPVGHDGLVDHDGLWDLLCEAGFPHEEVWKLSTDPELASYYATDGRLTKEIVRRLWARQRQQKKPTNTQVKPLTDYQKGIAKRREEACKLKDKGMTPGGIAATLFNRRKLGKLKLPESVKITVEAIKKDIGPRRESGQ